MKECKLCKNKYEESYFQKSGYCEDNNINLLRIPYWELKNIENILNTNLL